MGEVRPINATLGYQLPPIPARNWAPPEVITPGAKPEHYTTASEVYGLTLVLCEVRDYSFRFVFLLLPCLPYPCDFVR
jgi:hypothetical protein